MKRTVLNFLINQQMKKKSNSSPTPSGKIPLYGIIKKGSVGKLYVYADGYPFCDVTFDGKRGDTVVLLVVAWVMQDILMKNGERPEKYGIDNIIFAVHSQMDAMSIKAICLAHPLMKTITAEFIAWTKVEESQEK